jgi:hypothetical protein
MAYDLPVIPYAKLRITLNALQDCSLQSFKGSLFHGTLGHAPKPTVCVMSGGQPYGSCILKNQCVYTRIFETLTEGEPDFPAKFLLFQNYPSPFNSATSITYQINKSSHVIFKIFNSLGQEIRTLDFQWPAGIYTISWDGRDKKGNQVSSGLYFYTLQACEFSQTRKALCLR